jgi:putative aldouronate transport system substrate-binding protein
MINNFFARPETDFGLIMGCAGVNPTVPESVDELAVFLGAPQNWGFNKNGELVHAWLTDEYFKSVEKHRQWYAEGIINRNFLEITFEDAKKYLNTEQAGFLFGTPNDIRSRFSDLTLKNPKARLWYSLQHDDITIGTMGFLGGISMAKIEVKDEVLLRHCLSMINAMGEPEYQALRELGIEGEHFTMVDGVATMSEEQNKKFAATANQIMQFNVFQSVILNPIPVNIIPVIQALNQENPTYADTCVRDPTVPYISETQTFIGITELDPIRVDAINKYIMGTINKNQYEAAQRRWLEVGGAKVTKEFADQAKISR